MSSQRFPLRCRLGGKLLGALLLCAGVTLPTAFAHDAAQPVAQADAYRVLKPVRLYKGTAPGSDNWKLPETKLPDGSSLFNVSVPEYTAFLPDAARNTGTAVIIAPGGAFRVLAMDNEGFKAAQWLAERGIAAFVLKYRTVQITDLSKMMESIQSMSMADAGAPGVADGIEALRQIRAKAKDYAIDPNRVVFMGFSAGAHLASYVGLAADPAQRPNFVAPIYGAPFGGVPEFPAANATGALPPYFLALAQDDMLVRKDTMAFHDALVAKGYRPELHLYTAGGHGFGMRPQGTTSDHFIQHLFDWMQSNKLTRKPGDPEHKLTPPPGFGGF